MSTSNDALKTTVGRALGRVPSGIYILTANSDGPFGAIATMVSWVQQASFNPPAISVAIARDRAVGPILRKQKAFAISIIPEGDKAFMKKYARGIPDGADPFENIPTQKTASGIPILSDALAFLDCRLMTTCDFGGDHEIFFGEIIAGDLLREGTAFTHQRGNGFHY